MDEATGTVLTYEVPVEVREPHQRRTARLQAIGCAEGAFYVRYEPPTLTWHDGRVRIYTEAVGVPIRCVCVAGSIAGALDAAIPLARMEGTNNTSMEAGRAYWAAYAAFRGGAREVELRPLAELDEEV
jgi:hypothetical protein